MDRFAILVDAGYLYAAAGRLCCGTSQRSDLVLDPEKVTRFLRERFGNHCDLPHLRTYWYDGAPEAVPTTEQLAIGEQRGVKLRLGRLTPHGQKGVDSRVVRDLIILPRNGAVSTIYLMSGDEDVREGVVEAQERGVSVVLVGVEPLPGQNNQAATLVRESDDYITLSRSDCEGFLSRRGETEQQKAKGTVPGVPDEERTPAQGPTGLPRQFSPVEIEGEVSPHEFGQVHGRALRTRLESSVVGEIVDGRPRIPRHMDGWIISTAVERFGDPLEDDTRREIRVGFWVGLTEVPADAMEPEDEGNVETEEATGSE